MQEKAAITDNVIAGLQARNDLRAAILAFPERDFAACKFVRPGLQINIRHVLGIAQNGGIRNGQCFGNDASAHLDVHVHRAFQAFAGIGSFDARLQRTSGGVERRSEVLNFAVYLARIRFVFDGYLVADVHVGEIVLIDIGQNPHRTHVGKREALRIAGGEQLPRGALPVHNFTR